MKNLCKIVIDDTGFFRLRLPNGELLPAEIEMTIENNAGTKPSHCIATITLMCEHELINK